MQMFSLLASGVDVTSAQWTRVNSNLLLVGRLYTQTVYY